MGLYDGKVAVVTGARRGLGKIIAQHFLTEGAAVIGLARGGATFEDAGYTHFQVDVGKAEEVQDVFLRIARAFPALHVVVNNAGVFTSQHSLLMPPQRARAMVDTNLLGTFHVSREAAKIMRKGKYGRIVNIGSIATRIEPPGSAIYAACKAAVVTMANVMAKELAGFNITCNTLAVTFIDSDMLQQFPREQIDALVKDLPLSRYATGEDVCHVIDFFASEKSGYITAQTVFLGGIH
jgi:3-oxoacyl-[acyl-carrier protein] reductase